MRSRAAEALPILTVESGPTHLLTIEFDHGVCSESTDLRPHLPLILRRWGGASHTYSSWPADSGVIC